MPYRYKVVPFIGQSRGNLSTADVADQLEGAIRRYASEGWEFYQLSDANIEVQPGCISGLFGAKVQYVRFDQLIFRRDVENDGASPRGRRDTTVRSSTDDVRTGGEEQREGESTLEVPLQMNGTDLSRARKPWLSPFCHHCGADIPAASEKCPICGLKL